MNFDMNDVLSSKWMAKEDVPVHGVDLIMRTVSQESIGDDMEEKFALHFHGSYKPLLLNRTNTRIIMSLYGPKTDAWINQPICVYNDPTISYAGRLTGGVRLRMPQQVGHGARPAPAPVPPAPAGWPQPGNTMGAKAQAEAEYANATGGRPARPIPDLEDDIDFIRSIK